MNTACPFTLGQLVEVCGGRFLGAAQALGSVVHAVSPIQESQPGTITWITAPKFSKHLAETKAVGIIGTEALLAGHPRGIVVSDPEVAIAKVLNALLIPAELPPPGIHPMAIVDPSAKLGDGVRVGPFSIIHADTVIGSNTVIHEGVSIGRGVKIGSDCTLYDRCVLYDRSQLHDRVLLHAGVVIGAEGFGFIFRDSKHLKLQHLGNVIIENDVEIGPNSVVDRGKFGPTRIGQGTKIDALVMIAHNVQIGPLCLLAGQVGIAGSVELGTGVAVGGQAGVSHGMAVGDQARIGAQSGILTDIAAGQSVFGTPARDSIAQLRDASRVRRLQKIFDEVAELIRRVKALESSADHREHG